MECPTCARGLQVAIDLLCYYAGLPFVAVLETRRCLLLTKRSLIPDLDKPEEAVVGLTCLWVFWGSRRISEIRRYGAFSKEDEEEERLIGTHTCLKLRLSSSNNDSKTSIICQSGDVYVFYSVPSRSW